MSEETVSTEATTDEEIEETLQETSESEEVKESEDDAVENLEETATDEDEEDESEQPITKPAMVRALFNQLQNTKKAKLEGAYDEIMHTLTSLEETQTEEAINNESEESNSIAVNADNVDFSDDLSALFNDEADLSDEFKVKAKTIFEAALVAKLNGELEKIEEKFNKELVESREENLTNMVEQVDEYLSYAVDEWQKENELAITKGLQAEISEEFITGLRNLFTQHYIEIPDEKIDVADTLADRVDKLESELNESIEKSIDMQKQISEYEKTDVLISLSDNLVDTELEKLKELSEGVDFENVEQYANALGTLKENYFPKTGKAPQVITEEQDTEGGIIEEATGTMSAYVGAIDRTNRS